MKSVTLAVIFAGLISYGTIYTSTATPSHTSAYSSLAIDQPPLNSEPDDEEDHDRVKQPRRKTK